jgi:protein TonB
MPHGFSLYVVTVLARSLNLKEVETQEVYQAVQLAIEEEDIPITQMMNTPPPPPPPATST